MREIQISMQEIQISMQGIQISMREIQISMREIQGKSKMRLTLLKPYYWWGSERGGVVIQIHGSREFKADFWRITQNSAFDFICRPYSIAKLRCRLFWIMYTQDIIVFTP